MKNLFRNLMPLLFISSLLLTLSTCKKKEDAILYTNTIVPLQILGYSNVPSAILGQNFIRQLPARGGRPPYTWTMYSGTLPPGLTLNSKGRIMGTPTTTGEYTYTLELKDSKGASVRSSFTQKIGTVGVVPFMLLTPQIPAYGQNQDVGYQFFVEGGELPWTFTISGLPEGVSYDPQTGVIYGTPVSPSSGMLTISLRDAVGTEASGSPVTVTFQVNAPQPVNPGGVVGCPSEYDGNYIGEFKYTYYVKGQDNNYNPVIAGFQLSLTLECLATASGSTVLYVTKAVCSDPNFGCQLGGCTPISPSIATLPADPPTTPSNPSVAGQGIVIFFPNGSQILTANEPGALNVTTGGRILSNSLDPAFQNETWVAQGGNFPSYSVPPGGPVTEFTSWKLVWSATK